MVITERYRPIVLGVNGASKIDSDHVGGFLAVTAGTITITSDPDTGSTPITIVNAFPVAAGVYYPLPFYLSPTGGSVTLAGGASGTLGT